MPFTNEYITEVDCEKYNLKEICGEHNLANHGRMYSRSWTIDREKDTRVNLEKTECWSLYEIKGFVVPVALNAQKEQLIMDLRAAYSAYAGGGVFCKIANRSATVEFSEE